MRLRANALRQLAYAAPSTVQRLGHLIPETKHIRKLNNSWGGGMAYDPNPQLQRLTMRRQAATFDQMAEQLQRIAASLRRTGLLTNDDRRMLRACLMIVDRNGEL